MSGAVLVLGSANMDTTLRVDALPTGGQTVIGGDARLRPGGKGANQAVAAALAGARVRMAGRMGTDAYAAPVRAALDEAGVDTSRLGTVPDRSTGIAVVLVDRAGDNAIVVAPGANHAMTPADVDALRDDVAAADLLLLQLELPVDVVLRAVAVAGEVGTPVLLNLAPAVRLPAEVYGRLAVLVVNESEAEHVLGRALTSHDDLLAGAADLHALGPAVVVLTAGAAGAVLADASGARHVPAHPVEVVDTAGAGDAFVGVLAARLAAGAAPHDAVAAASRAAAVAVGTPGAQLTADVVLDLRGAG
jgi:ribokinase